MRTIPAQLLAHYRADVTRLAHLWRIDRVDGVSVFLTDHDDEIRYDGNVYKPSNASTPSALVTRSDLSVDNTEITGTGAGGVIPAGDITMADQLSGRYDGAEVRIFRLCYTNPEWGAELLKRGWLGTVSTNPGEYTLELRGLLEALQKPIGVVLQPGCRADLGDSLCGVNLAGYTHAGAVVAVTSQQAFSCSGLIGGAGYYDAGRIKFLSGENVGLSFEVKSSTAGGDLVLHVPPPGLIQVGDQIEVHAGCAKNMQTCRTKFNNLMRYSGEPWINPDRAMNPII